MNLSKSKKANINTNFKPHQVVSSQPQKTTSQRLERPNKAAKSPPVRFKGTLFCSRLQDAISSPQGRSGVNFPSPVPTVLGSLTHNLASSGAMRRCSPFKLLDFSFSAEFLFSVVERLCQRQHDQLLTNLGKISKVILGFLKFLKFGVFDFIRPLQTNRILDLKIMHLTTTQLVTEDFTKMATIMEVRTRKSF